jgi:hypothetical protein
VSSGTSPVEELEWDLLVQVDVLGVAIGVLCLLIVYGVLTIVGARRRSRRARYQPHPTVRAMTGARAPEASTRSAASHPTEGPALGADARAPVAQADVASVEATAEHEPGSAVETPRDTPEPREVVRRWLDESQRMLEATRRERAEMAEAFDGVATRLLQLEQAAGAVAQGLRARR